MIGIVPKSYEPAPEKLLVDAPAVTTTLELCPSVLRVLTKHVTDESDCHSVASTVVLPQRAPIDPIVGPIPPPRTSTLGPLPDGTLLCASPDVIIPSYDTAWLALPRSPPPVTATDTLPCTPPLTTHAKAVVEIHLLA